MKVKVTLVVPLVLFVYSPALGALVFHVEEVASSVQGIGSASLDHDPDGTPCIVYNDANTMVHYTYKSGTTWQSEPVGPGNWGSSLAVGTDGRARIAYTADWDTESRALKYAERTAPGSWNVTTVPTAAGMDQGYDPAIVLDANNRPHIGHWCFQGSPWHGLLYSHYDGSWHTEEVKCEEDVCEDGGAPSLALDSNGYPHMAVKTWGHELKYVSKNAGGWHAETLRSSSHGGSLVLDDSDRARIVCNAVDGSDHLTYFTNDGGDWQEQPITDNGSVRTTNCLALDSSGSPHIAYRAQEGGQYTVMKYAHRTPDGTWHDQTVHSASGVIPYQSLDFDLVDGTPAMVFSDGEKLYYAKGTTIPESPMTHVLAIGVDDHADTLFPGEEHQRKRIRGDYGAARVGTANWGGNASVDILPLDITEEGNLSQLTNKISEIEGRLNPGDNFVFFINTHGSPGYAFKDTLQAHEYPVNTQYDPDQYDPDGNLKRRIHADDEALTLVSNISLKDDELTMYFDSSTWDQVNKLFIIDACYSGGFWDGGLVDDLTGGDLHELPKAALLASSPEGDFSYAVPDDDGVKWGLLGQALVQSLDELGALGYDQVNLALLSNWTMDTANTMLDYADPRNYGFILGFPEDNWGVPVEITDLSFSTYSTDDFDMQLDLTPVPEPSSIALTLVGLAILFVYSRRRRRRGA